MKDYTLQYTNECQNEVEHDFQAENFEEAIKAAKYMARGNEGLWFGITLVGFYDEEEYNEEYRYYEIIF